MYGGAADPVTLTERHIFTMPGGSRTGGGWGTKETITIAPFEWTRIVLTFPGPWAAPLEQLPPNLDAEISLSNPRDSYVVQVGLELKPDGSKYEYRADWGYSPPLGRGGIWRPRGRVRRFLRAVSRGRLGQAPNRGR